MGRALARYGYLIVLPVALRRSPSYRRQCSSLCGDTRHVPSSPCATLFIAARRMPADIHGPCAGSQGRSKPVERGAARVGYLPICIRPFRRKCPGLHDREWQSDRAGQGAGGGLGGDGQRQGRGDNGNHRPAWAAWHLVHQQGGYEAFSGGAALELVKFFRTPITVFRPPAAPWLLATDNRCSCGA